MKINCGPHPVISTQRSPYELLKVNPALMPTCQPKHKQLGLTGESLSSLFRPCAAASPEFRDLAGKANMKSSLGSQAASGTAQPCKTKCAVMQERTISSLPMDSNLPTGFCLKKKKLLLHNFLFLSW